MSAITPGSPQNLPGPIEAIGAGPRRRNPFVATPVWVAMLPISDGALRLWIFLEGHVNEAHNGHRWCYPNQDDIAAQSKMSERSIRRHTKELVDAGLVVTKTTWDPAANRKKTYYLVNNEPPSKFAGHLSLSDFYAEQRNSSSETNRPDCPVGKEGNPNRPDWPVPTGQIGRFVPAKLADKQDQANKIKGTRSKQTLSPAAARPGSDALFDIGDSPKPKSTSVDEKFKIGTEDEGFKTFYENAYPRKVDRRDAQKAWVRAMKAGADPSMLIEAARKYGQWCKANPQIGVKYPATWLNKESWTNELDMSTPVTGKSHKSYSEDRSVWDNVEEMQRKTGIRMASVVAKGGNDPWAI